MFALMYFIQGMLNGFATIAFAAYLVERGIVDSNVAGLVAVFFLPWTFKAIWSIPIDLLTRRNQAWPSRLINFAQGGCTVGLCAMSTISISPNSWLTLIWLMFITCVFVSLQDVAADTLAIRTSLTKELPLVNSGMRFGRYVGVGFGALASGFGLAQLGYSLTVLVFASVSFGVMIITYYILKRNQRLIGLNNPSTRTYKFNSFVAPTSQFLKSRSVIMLLLFGFFVSLSESMIEFSIKPVFINGLNWSSVKFSMYCSFGSFLTATGAAVAGLLVLRKSCPVQLVAMGAITAASISVVFSKSVNINSCMRPAYLVGFPTLFSVCWVGFLTLAMQNSAKGFSATKFAALATLCNLGTLAGPLMASFLKEQLSTNYSEIIFLNGISIIFLSVLFTLLYQHDDVA